MGVRVPSAVAGPVLAVMVTLLSVAAESPSRKLTFEHDVRPILKANCFQCHGEAKRLSGRLDLRLRRLIVKGGRQGAAIVAGKPESSVLLHRVKSGEMPPEDAKPLSPREIEILERWIATGAETAGPEPEQIAAGMLITPEDRAFWSFQPVGRPGVPVVIDRHRVRTPVDAFVLARLESQKRTLSADADRQTLLRRAHFDLLGLPPTPEEAEAFLADDRPDAYEQLIDRLLASPRYGERWARHWLDVAGYADSEGYNDADAVRPWAYKYRDYVIESLNRDKPGDVFIREQLAGDEMLSSPHEELDAEGIEKLTATGFLRLGPDGTASGDARARHQVVADTIEIVSTALVGLTVGCARCHHHRYDPIPQDDFYRLRAIFDPAFDTKSWKRPAQRLVSLYTDADRAKARAIEADAKTIEAERSKKLATFIQRTVERELAKLPAEIRESVRIARETPADKRTAEQQKLLREHPSVNVSAGSLYLYDSKAAAELAAMAKKAEELRATRPVEEFLRALTEAPGNVPPTHVFHRGDPEQPRQTVAPGGLTILASAKLPAVPGNDAGLPTSGRRLNYARRLTDPRHPLTARVLVNRVWLHHFGRGIVPTPGDFGALGERPTHPELLDWLASEFVATGWSLKRLHRLIMTSTVYRQAGWRHTDDNAHDVDNRLYDGMPLRRLEAEVLRDAILAVSGKLNLKPFGPAIPVMADRVGQWVIGKENLNAGRPGPVIPMHGEEFRRSIYVQVRRSRPLTVLSAFDLPRMEPNCARRTASTVATQSLLLMNSEFVVRQSEYFAQRVRREVGDDRRAQIDRAWRLAFARRPSAEELDKALVFLEEQARSFDSVKATERREKALASLCQTLLGSNEFLYVD